MTTDTSRIADQIRRAAAGDAWHGPPLAEVLTGLSAAEAAAHPIPGAHSIWELVGHLTTWTRIVGRRLDGQADSPADAENFPVVTDASAGAWAAACKVTLDAHEALAAAVERRGDASLEETVPGQSYSVYVMLQGAVQHTLYHAGQIAILRRALAASAA
jgi:uncharacterized damage-inducible protein DinB